MKQALFQMRVEPALKRSFRSAARFQHQTLSQFMVQAAILAVERARRRGLGIKPPMQPRDQRFGKHMEVRR